MGADQRAGPRRWHSRRRHSAVFDRYHRGANVVGSTLGEGIGLASARQLVEWHGGRLTVVSTEG